MPHTLRTGKALCRAVCASAPVPRQAPSYVSLPPGVAEGCRFTAARRYPQTLLSLSAVNPHPQANTALGCELRQPATQQSAALRLVARASLTSRDPDSSVKWSPDRALLAYPCPGWGWSSSVFLACSSLHQGWTRQASARLRSRKRTRGPCVLCAAASWSGTLAAPFWREWPAPRASWRAWWRRKSSRSSILQSGDWARASGPDPKSVMSRGRLSLSGSVSWSETECK